MLRRLRPNGAEVLATALVRSGARTVFGIPGVHNLVLYEALRRSAIRIVPATHEQGAAFMATGYSRATGQPGIFITVPGPGLTNSLTPVAEALVDSTPVVGIVTAVPRSPRKYQMHEIDQTQVVKAIVKAVHTVRRGADLPSALAAALATATTGEPGPCVLQIPADVLWERVDRIPPGPPEHEPDPVPPDEMERVLTRLASARRVGLIVGLGAADAAAEVTRLAECLSAPVATTGSGRGVIDEEHPLSLGFGWIAGAGESVNRVLAACDLVLAIGVRFSQTGTHDYGLRLSCPLIHVDRSASVLGQNYKADIAVAMDAREFLGLVLSRQTDLGPKADSSLLELIRTERAACRTRRCEHTDTELSIGDFRLSPPRFYDALRALLPIEAILVTDAGFNERLTLHNWVVRAPRTLISSSDYESMGFAIPTAIGAAMALPDRKIVAVVGDGGLVMSGLEMMTAVRERSNLSILALNNGGFGAIKRIQHETFGSSVAVDVGAPDFKLLADSIGLRFQPAVGGLDALEQTIRHEGPALLEVKLHHRDENGLTRLTRRWKNDLKQGARALFG